MTDSSNNSKPSVTTSEQHQSEISPADIEWESTTLVSKQFGDLYFSKDGGLAETEYVFLAHNQLAERWRKLQAGDQATQYFCIAETGFGTGLNFLAAVQLWQTIDLKQTRLHYISFEKYPLAKDTLRSALELQKIPQELIAELIVHYPPHTPGFHRLELFGGQVLLTLCFGDANKLLPQLSATVDAWFLDGFSPAKNPDLWQSSLFQAMAKHSTETTTFATFTAASQVRKGLKSAGFEIRKSPGYGKKREMISGNFVGTKEGINLANETTDTRSAYPPPNHHDKPWFSIPQIESTSQDKNKRTCLVIGGGLAGTASAYALAKRGWQVTLLERESALASGASGNPTGVLFTKLSPHDSPQNRFNQLSFLYAIQHMRAVLGESNRQDPSWHESGVLQLAYDSKESARQQEIIECGLWPAEIAYPVDAKQASEIAGIKQTTGGLFFPQAGWVNPPSLCSSRTALNNIDLVYCTEALSLQQIEAKDNQPVWNIDAGEKSYQANHVIIANARDALTFEQTKTLPLRNLRGQISFVEATDSSKALSCVLCYDGYSSPARENFHCVGATFHPKDENIDLRDSDHTLNINQLKEAAPQFLQTLSLTDEKALTGRAQVRCQTPDYLPIVGPVADADYYLEAYAPLRKGMLRRPFPPARYLNNLFVNLGHGSRGLTTSAFAAEMIAAYMTGEPQPIDKDTLNALHPGRFLIRDLKRRVI